MTDAAWPLVVFAAALFLLNMVALGIGLQRAPLAMADIVAALLLVLLIAGYRNGGVSPLEKVDVCTPPAHAWPRAPQPTADLAGCPNFRAQVIDPAHDIPVKPLDGQLPDGSMPTPSWAAKP